MPTGNGDMPAMDDEFSEIAPRQVTLRDRVTVATLVPFHSSKQVPQSLIVYLSGQLNREIEKGDTYAMVDPIPVVHFRPYWFSNFGAVMLIGDIKSATDVQNMDGNVNWAKACLGSFNIRPNYPGRSSHVCNGMFLVTDAARNKGVGRLMGEAYLDWAARLVSLYDLFSSTSDWSRGIHTPSLT
jgi:GNAT superfamily N-acetyltransferase